MLFELWNISASIGCLLCFIAHYAQYLHRHLISVKDIDSNLPYHATYRRNHFHRFVYSARMRFTNYSPIPASFTLFITFILLLITSTQAASTARGEATFFNPGLGACGYVHGDGDMVVALSWQRFGGKNPCGRRIKVRRGNRVAWATVVDKCMGCVSLPFFPSNA